LDRRTNTKDGSGGASPTVVTDRRDDDDDVLMAGEVQTSEIVAARPAKDASANGEVSANGSSGADGTDVAEVPALPADSIGSPRDSFSFSRPVSAPVAPAAGEDWTLGADDGTFSPEPVAAGAGTGWSAGSSPFGTSAGTETSTADPPPADPGPAQAAAGPEAPTVSAAAFVWDPPEPAPTSPSSPARNFLRSSASAKTPAPPRTPPVSVNPPKPQDGPGRALGPGARPKGPGSPRRSARQAHLTIARVEPWSVTKFSFMVSLVAFMILFVAVSVLYGTLSALGVFTSLQHVVQSVTSSQDSNGVNAASWFTASRVLSWTAMLGVLNIVLITAMCTIGAVIYNLSSRLIGGVEVTLRETE
jgi:Transmembrane domain of unknown function (DUF3566)